MTVRLTDLLGRAVQDEDGSAAGRLLDLVVSLENAHPHVRRLRVGRHLGASLDYPAAGSGACKPVVVSRRAASPPSIGRDELFLGRHVLDAQIVDLGGKRITRVGDVVLGDEDGRLSVLAVLVGAEPLLRRLRLGRLAGAMEPARVAWEELHLVSRPRPRAATPLARGGAAPSTSAAAGRRRPSWERSRSWLSRSAPGRPVPDGLSAQDRRTEGRR